MGSIPDWGTKIAHATRHDEKEKSYLILIKELLKKENILVESF